MYYLKHEQLADIKNDRSNKFIGEVIFKNTLWKSRKSKLNLCKSREISITYKLDTTQLWFFFVFSSWIINEFWRIWKGVNE
jgi:hypothetical protein